MRNMIPRIRTLVIDDTSNSSNHKVTKEKLIKTLQKVEEEEEILEIKEVSGWFEPSGFGMYEPGEKIYQRYWELTLRKHTPETDEEYEHRMNFEEQIRRNNEENEKLEYLRLKAKFEK